LAHKRKWRGKQATGIEIPISAAVTIYNHFENINTEDMKIQT
jgi:hypothetical protein